MVPQRISDLTTLALKDGVMTFRERQVIEEEGIRLGMEASELKNYLDEAIRSRISQESKDTLQACPGCGGQIPLLSKQCQYCGHTFGKVAANIYKVREGDEAAQIIEQENADTEANRKNISNCPNCGAPYPLISNICGHCHHVLHEPNYDPLNVDRLIKRIRKCISSANKSVPTLGELLKKNWFLYLTILNLMLYAVVAHYFGIAWTLLAMIVLFIVQVWFLGDKILKSTSNQVENRDRQYYLAQTRFQMLSSEVSVLYGNHPEMSGLISHLSTVLEAVSGKRNSTRKRVLIINTVLVVISVGLLIGLLMLLSNH